MARRLFSDAVRVYLINLLHETQATLAVHEEEAVMFSSYPDRMSFCKIVVDNARRVMDFITKCQYEDSRGIHPFFAAAALAAIDRAQQALLHSVLAAKHFGRASFLSLNLLMKNSAKLVTYSIRYIVDERRGDAALSSLSMQAIARIDAARDSQLARVPVHVEKALRNVKRIQESSVSAQQKGWTDVENAWKQALYLTRAAELAALTSEGEAELDEKSTALTRAAEYQIQAAELLTLRRRMDVSISSGAMKLIAAAANAFKDAADLCKTVKLSRSHDVCTSDELRVDRLVQRGRRLHNDALSLSQLQQDLDDLAAGEVAVNTACCACKHPGLASALAQLGEEYRIAKELTGEYLCAVLAERSDDIDVRKLEETARDQRLKCFTWKVFLTEVVGNLVKTLRVCTARAAALQGETAPCVVAARECWEAAASNLTILVDSELDRRLDLMQQEDLPRGLTPESEVHRIVADYFVGIAKGVLALAAEYQRSALLVVGTGEVMAVRRECWREACEYATAAAREGMKAMHATLAGRDELVRTTAILRVVTCPKADKLEIIATAFANAAQRSVGTFGLNRDIPAHIAQQLAELENQTFAALVTRAKSLVLITLNVEKGKYIENDPMALVRNRLAAAETEVRIVERFRRILLGPVTQVASAEVDLWRHSTIWARKATKATTDGGDARLVRMWRCAIDSTEWVLYTTVQGDSTDAQLKHRAFYHWAGAAEALEAGKVWDSYVLEHAAKALLAAMDSRRSSDGKVEVMFALHCLIAQQLLKAARDVTDAFVPTAVCSLHEQPVVAAEYVHIHASDITRTILEYANCYHHAAKSSQPQLWGMAASLADYLRREKIAVVRELSLRDSEDNRPSKHADKIAKLELEHQTRMRNALSAEGRGGEDPRTESL